MGVELEDQELERLALFLGLMLEVNKTTNLTAITEPSQAWTRHIFDALSLVPVLASAAEAEEDGGGAGSGEGPAEASISSASRTPSGSHAPRVIDIGSGGGVPALPLAIVMPGHDFTLVESTGKKARFLEEAIRVLGLTNARVCADRAEVLGHVRKGPRDGGIKGSGDQAIQGSRGRSSGNSTQADAGGYREQFDVAMARALGHLAVVCELCAPLVRPGGIVVAVKGEKAEQELSEAAKALGLLGLRHVQTLETPTGRLVLLEKTTRTPRTYPRRPGEPARVPLGVERVVTRP